MKGGGNSIAGNVYRQLQRQPRGCCSYIGQMMHAQLLDAKPQAPRAEAWQQIQPSHPPLPPPWQAIGLPP